MKSPFSLARQQTCVRVCVFCAHPSQTHRCLCLVFTKVFTLFAQLLAIANKTDEPKKNKQTVHIARKMKEEKILQDIHERMFTIGSQTLGYISRILDRVRKRRLMNLCLKEVLALLETRKQKEDGVPLTFGSGKYCYGHCGGLFGGS